jgi:acetyl-CoA/propionyl-CoA carboxylase biotin carboxyl carrier protein
MLSKVLVANRGEIAVRVIRACRESGIKSVAVYSDLDTNALHVRLADEAWRLGGQSATESYLDVAKVLEIVDKCGADGVHPGYGFLSENADFARAVTEKGVAFIGPSPEAIEIMGDKLSAREAAEKVGVSGVPGTSALITKPEEVTEFANEHGWPVAVKAAYGGGGRGMKVVESEDEVESAVDSARRESMASFGRDELYLERYLISPRHVEVQILADSHGNIVYLGDRDCSAQRRHQKLVEEAPAPNIPDDVRVAMGEAAVAVARGCDYTNAGTVEFLFQDGEFFYLEMNTRLQVEHPVTEMVTGIDLVEQQLRIASGEPLGFSQDDIVTSGHSIEFRINAENPAGGRFLPSPGHINALKAPDGFGVRFDSGYEAGDEVSQFYDNLIGKLVVWGSNRDIAIRRGLRALDELEVSGMATTASAASVIIGHPDFQNVTHSTRWVEEQLEFPEESVDQISEEGTTFERRQATVEVNGRRFEVNLLVPDSKTKPPRRSTSGLSSSGSGSGQVVAPMQGTIVNVLVEEGSEIEAGDPICVLEAMKMENNVIAEKSGVVKEVLVSMGDSVGAGDILAVIE